MIAHIFIVWNTSNARSTKPCKILQDDKGFIKRSLEESERVQVSNHFFLGYAICQLIGKV